MKKKNRKYLNIPDRFPYILLIIIIGFTIIFFFIVKNNLPLNFFSGPVSETIEEESDYSVFITSPVNNKVYNFINFKETVPLEIKSKQAENEGFRVSILVNEEEIKILNSPPYEYNWNPSESGEYDIIARVLDEQNNILSESNKVTIVIAYDLEESETSIINMDIEEKKEKILAESAYRPQNTIPGNRW